ncbi:hypothetical protein BDV12DRAFT_39001 [Aspergillus spectabilis]
MGGLWFSIWMGPEESEAVEESFPSRMWRRLTGQAIVCLLLTVVLTAETAPAMHDSIRSRKSWRLFLSPCSWTKETTTPRIHLLRNLLHRLSSHALACQRPPRCISLCHTFTPALRRTIFSSQGPYSV